MKAVITILQARRVVLPHVFLRYVLPRMQECFPGELEAVVIQHRANAAGGNRRLESLKGDSDERLDRVLKWTEEGRFAGATVLPHDVIHRPYPSIPTVHRGVQAALERDADFHIWLEDDALLLDFDCADWDKLLGQSEVGVYRRFHYLNTAYLVTRRSFAERIEKPLSRYDDWSENSRLEKFLWRQLATSRAYLKPENAVRYHHQYYPYTGLRYVADALRRIAPEALPLLDIDFGEGAQDAAPVSAEEMLVHAAKDGSGLANRLRRVRSDLRERYRRARESRG